MGTRFLLQKRKEMKIAIAALVGLVAAQDGSCTKDLDCGADANGEKQRCATMTMEGFSVDQCVAEILCGETMELEGVEMSYNCFDKKAAAKLFASMAAALTAAYLM